MRLFYAILLLLAGVIASTKKNLIVDTDLFSDVDDAGALLLAATLPNVNLLAVNVNYPSTFSALAASAILAHYGRPDVPIGIRRPMTNITFFDTWKYELGEYASKIAYHWSGGSLPWGHAEEAWDPATLYRKVLAESDDGSVTIASIGFLDNLSALLNSTSDSYSPLDGRELVHRKVAELVVMGGSYPKGHSYNFWGSDPSLAAHVINSWDSFIPMTFVGDDVGKHILSGGPLMKSDFTDDPIRMAYIYYMYTNPRSSWDPLTILYAANGLGSFFELGAKVGRNHIEENGTNSWITDARPGTQHFLRLKASNKTAAIEVDRLFLAAAKRFSKKKAKEWDHTEFSFRAVLVWIVGVSCISMLGYYAYGYKKYEGGMKRATTT